MGGLESAGPPQGSWKGKVLPALPSACPETDSRPSLELDDSVLVSEAFETEAQVPKPESMPGGRSDQLTKMRCAAIEQCSLSFSVEGSSRHRLPFWKPAK